MIETNESPLPKAPEGLIWKTFEYPLSSQRLNINSFLNKTRKNNDNYKQNKTRKNRDNRYGDRYGDDRYGDRYGDRY